MGKTISVKKNKLTRYSFRAMILCFLLLAAGIFLWTREPLLAAPMGVPLCFSLPVTVYCETWELSFGPEGIRRHVFFRETGVWTWSDIRDAIQRWSTAENSAIVRLRFSDGKQVSFRLNDQQAKQARAYILRHHSLRDSS